MNVYIPDPGTSMFDDKVKSLARTTGLDSVSIRLVLITLVQNAETKERQRRESEDRENRYGPDI